MFTALFIVPFAPPLLVLTITNVLSVTPDNQVINTTSTL